MENNDGRGEKKVDEGDKEGDEERVEERAQLAASLRRYRVAKQEQSARRADQLPQQQQQQHVSTGKKVSEDHCCSVYANRTASLSGVVKLMEERFRNYKVYLKGGVKDGFQHMRVGGKTLLSIAANNGHTDIVLALLKVGADVNTLNDDRSTPLMLAAFKGHIQIVSVLIQAGADVNAVNKSGRNVLIQAVGRGHKDVVLALLQAGADPNASNKTGKTALDCARTWNEKKEIEDILIAAGAQPGQNTSPAATAAIQLMEQSGQRYKEFLDAGATKQGDMNALVGSSRMTALMQAATSNDLDILLALIEADANLDLTDKFGDTALMRACLKGHANIVKAMVKAGVDVNAKNRFFETALDYANNSDNEEIQNILRESGASDD